MDTDTQKKLYKLLREYDDAVPDDAAMDAETRAALRRLTLLEDDLAHPEELFPPVPVFRLPAEKAPVVEMRRSLLRGPIPALIAAVLVLAVGLFVWYGRETGPRMRGQEKPPAKDLIGWVRAGDVGRVAVLADAVFNPDLRDGDGRPLLWSAARHNHPDMLALLLDRGADIDAVDPEGRSALMAAAENGHIDCVRLLLRRGADTGMMDVQGHTAEALATQMGWADIVALLQE